MGIKTTPCATPVACSCDSRMSIMSTLPDSCSARACSKVTWGNVTSGLQACNNHDARPNAHNTPTRRNDKTNM